MTAGLLYTLNLLFVWAGWLLIGRAIYLAFLLLTKSPSVVEGRTAKATLVAAFSGGLFLLASLALPEELGRPAPAGLSLPIVWYSMPFTAWFTVGGVAIALWRAVQWTMAVSDLEHRQRATQSVAWLAFAIASFVAFHRSGDPIEIIRGSIPLSTTVVGAIVAFALAAMLGIALSTQGARGRGIAGRTAIYFGLVAGSILFSIPFAWLLITSFKEDRAIANAQGIEWVPYVYKTVPYDDPTQPYYRGKGFEGILLDRLPDGRLRIDIRRPLVRVGQTAVVHEDEVQRIPSDVPLVTFTYNAQPCSGRVIKELDDGSRRVEILTPPALKGVVHDFLSTQVEPVKTFGFRWRNYTDALEFLPPETMMGLAYLKNTLILVIMGVVGTVFSSALVAYGFSRMRFPGKNALFMLLLSTMMLPGAVTLLPTFLIFRSLGWIDTLYPLWVPSFFAGAFNVFLLRQFFLGIPMELEDAAKIDGCSYMRTWWRVMMPQVRPACVTIGLWTAMGAWNNFMGPLIYISSPERMPLAYAVQLFQGQRGGEAGLMMAFATMAMLPVLLLFFFAQKYFIEGVTLTGLGGR